MHNARIPQVLSLAVFLLSPSRAEVYKLFSEIFESKFQTGYPCQLLCVKPKTYQEKEIKKDATLLAPPAPVSEVHKEPREIYSLVSLMCLPLCRKLI